MAAKLGRDYLERAAQGQDLVKAVKAKKADKGPGKDVVFWKFIRKVFPQYKFQIQDMNIIQIKNYLILLEVIK